MTDENLQKPRVASIGECMLELSGAPAPGPARSMNLGYGGDTLNTAVYLARLDIAADYVTALGDDSHSQWMIKRWQAEGVGTELVYRLPGRVPGLYMIDTDPDGERHFSYWRSAAPARELFDDVGRVDSLAQALKHYDLVYFSGISLSLYNAAARERLYALLAQVRAAGVKVGFDGNFRPAGWPDRPAARAAFTRACEHADIVLPTFEDECDLFGDTSPEATIERIASAGAREIVLKQGRAGCRVWCEGDTLQVPAQPVARPLDTTAAGDSFNAGYLAARLRGMSLQEAAVWGHRLAAGVIQVRGAIIPVSRMPLMLDIDAP
ncbi:sugar kinase [Parahaliea aestuarii]|uniref:2-dehydro-3-deoxygluconokinase n=1 Tax=Parahaliea aestuarii TaxID=1852021 RepID=A0A5C8ZX12_9GAMM|nr:sugar kinase [Parahaliea aestuarii]TXS91731.1 sugar kinase [Parahaliea aestuarii]